MLNGPFILGALTAVDALILGILISVAYGSFGYRKGARHGLGMEGFKTYAIWGWSGSSSRCGGIISQPSLVRWTGAATMR